MPINRRAVDKYNVPSPIGDSPSFGVQDNMQFPFYKPVRSDSGRTFFFLSVLVNVLALPLGNQTWQAIVAFGI